MDLTFQCAGNEESENKEIKGQKVVTALNKIKKEREAGNK